MVMRNRHEGSNTPHWWDDLPPHIRHRFRESLADQDDTRATNPEPAEPPPRPAFSRSELLADLSRFAAVFGFVAIFILLYLLVVMSFIVG